ncbi:MAG: hypothetical protein SNJ84_00775 [Verrucomicrobiia bacterium]
MNLRPRALRPERGMTLVVVLLMVLTCSIAVVAYVTLMQTDRRASSNYANAIRASEMANSGFTAILANLQQEIKSGSESLGAPSPTGPDLHVPRSRHTVAPARIGTTGQLNAHPNLLRVSASPNDFDAWINSYAHRSEYQPDFPDQLVASSVATDVLSANRRRVSRDRWMAPMLTDPAQVANFPLPHWIYVARDGIVPRFNISPASTQPTAGNGDFVVGRFAYAIYDLGGLLDINVAGYSGLVQAGAAAEVAAKGSLAMADLTRIPGIDNQANVDRLVNWRNRVTAATAPNYIDYLRNWLRQHSPRAVFPGDNTYLSRQDLLAYQRENAAHLSPQALRYLTTFSRGLNAPSWSPAKNAADFGGSANGSFAYRDLAETALIDWNGNGLDTDPNPNRRVPNIRVQTPFTRLDGSAAEVGEPLVDRRFPLSRLNWLAWNSATDAGRDALDRINAERAKNGASPIPNLAELIRLTFGLTLVSGNLDSGGSFPLIWSYDEVNSGGRIRTLQEVAAIGREPNFFELLKAGILHGSLGKTGGNPQNPDQDTAAATAAIDVNQDIQIIRIGANLLDQADADSVPTTIRFVNPETATPTMVESYGVESLPYLSRVTFAPYRIKASSPPDRDFRLYMLFELWNPHANATQLQPDAGLNPANPAVAPRRFRISVTGTMTQIRLWGFSNLLTGSGKSGAEALFPKPWPVMWDSNRNFPARNFSASEDVINFETTDTNRFERLTFTSPDSTSHTSPTDLRVVDDGRQRAVGILCVRDADLPFQPFRRPSDDADAGRWPFTRCAVTIDPSDPLQVALQWTPDGINWFTYDILRNWRKTAYSQNPIEDANSQSRADGPFTRDNSQPSTRFLEPRTHYLRAGDPRNTRFGLWLGDSTFEPGTLWGSFVENTERHFPRTSARTNKTDAIAVGWTQPDNISNVRPPRLLANNNNSGEYASLMQTPTRYTDPDQVLRRGDYVFGLFNDFTFPINPYLQSLGMTPRPIILNRPLRSVAEMGYAFRDQPWKTLDFMTTESADSGLLDLFSVDDRKITQGVVHLSGRNREVWQALLSGAARDTGTSDLVTTAQATTMADQFVNSARTNPLVNMADLVNDHLRIAVPAPTSGSGSTSAMIKPRREVFIRALADTGQTRVWNLLIDVIGQSGRFPTGMTSADRFVVEGESRIWYHVAIDRWTGEILEIQEEVVHE